MVRRMFHPVVLVALATLALLWARLAEAQVPPTQRVPVATHALARGAVLGAGDFEMRDTTVRFGVDTNHIVVGWVTRRSIAAGEVLRVPAVEAPTVINANSPVECEWVDGNVKLTVQGIAARNAAMGERVPVRTESGKRIEGTVVAPGRVRID
ncbi:MAG TPA: flagellar basal body P-ring formation chaperone FlgA [Gemmatimonadaceae bacterium]|nr:flagellar basal body P-ring formation chaperone FlgA [Gemmatimonadaceae bacterium]